MRTELHATIDPIRELRLRTWARRNHVPVGERDLTWHPVVLDEMLARDAEEDHSTAEPALEPVVETPTVEATHPAADWLRGELAAALERLSTERAELEALAIAEFEEDVRFVAEDVAGTMSAEWGPRETTISAYVPLPPGPFHVVHEAHVGVRAPHLFSGAEKVADTVPAVPECW